MLVSKGKPAFITNRELSQEGIANIHFGQLTDSCNQPQKKKGKPKL